jgi:hypothetical protein
MGLDLQQTQGQAFGAAGSNHAPGLVPDPGSTANSGQVLQDYGWNKLVQVSSPSNANAATAGVPVGGLYTSTANPAPVYIRTA